MLSRLRYHALLRQFIHFAAVGVTGTLIQYASLWVGVEYFSTSAPSASAIGYVLGSIVNYLLNYFFTFGSDKSHTEAASKYFFIIGVGWCFNLGLMILFVDHFGWYYWFGQLVTTGLGLLWNFSGSKWWAFKHKS